MPLYEITVPILAGGLSKQPAQVRLPDQVNRAENVTFSVAKGCSKRMGMQYRFPVSGFDSAVRAISHPINRDATEQYRVVVGKTSAASTIRVVVYDSAGTASVATISAAARTYLQTGGIVPSNMRLATIGDGTFILNTAAIPKVKSTASFQVTKKFPAYGSLRSYISTKDTYFRTDDADESFSAGYWKYDDSLIIDPVTNQTTSQATTGATFAKMIFPTLSGAAGVGWTSPNGSWDSVNINGTHRFGFRRYQLRASGGGAVIASPVYTYNGTTKVLTITGANDFVDYIWQAGDMIRVTNTLGGWVAGTWYKVVGKIDNLNLQLGEDAPAGSSVPTGNEFGVGGNVSFDFAGTAFSTLEECAAEIERQIQVLHPHVTAVWFELDGSGSDRRGRIEIGCPFRGRDSLVFAPVYVSGYNWTLVTTPLYTTGATSVAGTGLYNGVNILDPDRRWIRTEQPNQTDGAIDATTMPVLMKRISTGPAVFSIDVAPWAPRYNGGTANNKPASILTSGRPLSSLCVFRDRLALSGGEVIVLSVTGDYFNLWIEDAGNIVDSDPIEVRPNIAAVANVQRMIPLGRSIFVLCEGGRQFELTAVDALTPSTVSYTPSTSHISQNIQPAVIGPTAYFTATTPLGTTLMEYFRSDDLTVPEAAADVGAHVEGLFASPLNLVAEPSTRSVLVLPQLAAGASLYLYRSFFLGQQKRQSAWSTVLVGAATKIHDAISLDRDFWLLAEIGGSLAFYSLPTDNDAAAYLLDSWIATSGWSNANPSTLSNPTSDTGINTVIDGSGVARAVTGTTTLTATGVNLFGQSTVVGRSYDGIIELSRQYPRDNGGTPKATGRARYQSVELGLGTPGPLLMQAISQAGVIRSLTLASGTTSPRAVLWAAGDADATTVRITMNQPKRVTITSLSSILEQVNTA